MTASVGGLLDDVHALAWGLASSLTAGAEHPSGPDRERLVGWLVAWPRLASATVWALDAVPLGPEWAEDTAWVKDALLDVAAGPTRTPSRTATLADRDVLAMAVRLGAVADLLAGQPKADNSTDRRAALGVRASILAPVHALALATAAALPGIAGVADQRWLLRRVAARTEGFAMVPVARRSGRYEDVAATSVVGTLDAAIADWGRATTTVLASRHLVTGTALQVAAGDVVILTAAAATVTAAALELGLVDRARGQQALSALTAAHTAWRSPTRWPEDVRLDGVRVPEQTFASRRLRQVVTDDLRQGGSWLSAAGLAERTDVAGTLATMRRGLHAAGNVAVAHFQAIENLARGTSQLWIAATAIERPALRGLDVIEAACRRGWVTMPRGEPAAERLLTAARDALTLTTVALAALDATQAAPPPPTASGESVRWEQGRIVARAPAVGWVVERIPPGELSGRRAERRALPRQGGRGRPGPRR